MNLSRIFSKPVDRHIDGVIKADDLQSLRLEVEEYVLTTEIENRLDTFLDAYNNYEGANGVWISGFFGSGKSHLLKMLALMLENRKIDEVDVLETFLGKCEHNGILTANLKKACQIPSQSILFNIDQKAAIISKQDLDALLAVFVKVFDEMCGYYGKQPYIAEFERDLDKRDLYKKFQNIYQQKAGIPWDQGREEVIFEADNIAAAYAEVTGASLESGQNILDKYRDDYSLSIEDFAVQINEYIEARESNFRLNFFVDEVGQYIADNTKLMTNLQTLAESLATKCRGRAWIIVTAQEDMNTVVGEMGKQQSNDFSKIQARFANKLKLTSQDVAEVIQKRLLMKNEEGIDLLSDLYHEQHNNFKTLFDFSDGSQTFKNFQDKDHFIQAYPFIPYQFNLFQNAIQSLSEHNAFEGRHSSVGERSMLAVFRVVAIQIAEKEIGELATFDLMYEGLKTALKSNMLRAIHTAEKNLDNELAIKLLKVLFLVKYIKGFKATVRNLCVLMHSGFDTNIGNLRKSVEEALRLLEGQENAYISRNGDVYEYLTNEEQDIENEIKNTDVESADVSEEMSNIIFDQVIKVRKIQYADNGQDYPFSRKLDDQLFGREQELSIHIITPFYEHAGNETILKSHALGKAELTVLMPVDERVYADILTFKRTEKYLRYNGTALQDSKKRILSDKGDQNRKRKTELVDRIATQIGKAKLLVAGETLDLSGDDAYSRITRGFTELITRIYPNLRMLRGAKFKEDQVASFVNESGATLFGNDAIALSEPEQEMLTYIQNNKTAGTRTTLKLLIEQFEKKPYGWYLASILCIFAKICARGKVEVKRDSDILEDDELISAIRNSVHHGNMIIVPQIDFTQAQIRDLQQFYEEFFDTKTSQKEPKVLGAEVGKAITEKIHQLKELVILKNHYPFLEDLDPVLEKLTPLNDKNYSFYITQIPAQEDELLDLKEDVIDPIIRFMEGSTKDIYDDARNFLKDQENNFQYLPSGDAGTLSDLVSDNKIYKKRTIQDIKTLTESISTQLDSMRSQIRGQKIEKLVQMEENLFAMSEITAISVPAQERIREQFSNLKDSLKTLSMIAVINDKFRIFEEQDYPEILNRILEGEKSATSYEDLEGRQEGSSQGAMVAEMPKSRVVVSLKELSVNYHKAVIDSKEDLDSYIEAFKEACLSQLEAGKKVRI